MLNILKLFFPFGIPGVFLHTQTWDETLPAGTRALNLGDDDIRSFKTAVRERLQFGGMYFPSTDDSLAGEFSYMRMTTQGANPASVLNKGFLFTKTVSGIAELYYETDTGVVVQLTSGGKMLISSLVIGSETRGDLITRGASVWGRLGIGGANTYLKSDGTDPSWGNPNFQTAATEVQMEAATDNTVPVTPASTQWHPGVAKAWCIFNGTGAPAMIARYNMSATITRNGVGDYTLSFTTPFSSANYAFVGVAAASAPAYQRFIVNPKTPTSMTASTIRIEVNLESSGVYDCEYVSLVFFGDQ